MDHRSVNEVICHGIPDMRPLENGDLLNSEYVSFFFFHSIFMFVISAYYGKRDILKIVVLTSLEN